jgi:hypothetical protein
MAGSVGKAWSSVAIAWTFSSVPPASTQAVMPVARNTWQPSVTLKPASAVRRRIMR